MYIVSTEPVTTAPPHTCSYSESQFQIQSERRLRSLCCYPLTTVTKIAAIVHIILALGFLSWAVPNVWEEKGSYRETEMEIIQDYRQSHKTYYEGAEQGQRTLVIAFYFIGIFIAGAHLVQGLILYASAYFGNNYLLLVWMIVHSIAIAIVAFHTFQLLEYVLLNNNIPLGNYLDCTLFKLSITQFRVQNQTRKN